MKNTTDIAPPQTAGALGSGSGSAILSLFPGIGLLDRAFEEHGFCVLRGPDLLWGGDVRNFHIPAGVVDGVIGGPPCQAHSSLAAPNRALGNTIAPDMNPEFVRVVMDAAPVWWLAENVPGVPDIEVPGYITRSVVLDNRWLGEEQSRRRRWQFGTHRGIQLHPQLAALENPRWESACLASEGEKGQMLFRAGKSTKNARRPFDQFCRLQGLPENFLEDSPLTLAGKYHVVGNGVPLAMGRVIACAVVDALKLNQRTQNTQVSAPAAGCGTPLGSGGLDDASKNNS